jgi:hypothetical protein
MSSPRLRRIPLGATDPRSAQTHLSRGVGPRET